MLRLDGLGSPEDNEQATEVVSPIQFYQMSFRQWHAHVDQYNLGSSATMGQE